jgi:hypothetical protein
VAGLCHADERSKDTLAASGGQSKKPLEASDRPRLASVSHRLALVKTQRRQLYSRRRTCARYAVFRVTVDTFVE